MSHIYNSITELVGKTPIVKLNRIVLRMLQMFTSN